MKIAHEAPLSIFDRVQKLTDYDYALVHLFEESEEYFDKFKQAVANGREVILDNSIFELGTAFSGDAYAQWVEKLQAEWYIIPDVLDDGEATIDSYYDFIEDVCGLPGKAIAVAQGKDYNDLVECYKFFDNQPLVKKIAISFDYPWLQKLAGGNKYERMMYGRQYVLRRMLTDGVINTDKPHHLLGCGLPQEFRAYHDMDWIDSVDTSNPVVHGILGIEYEVGGLYNKESAKLFTMIEEEVLDKMDIIEYNIGMFRKFCNG